MKRSKALTLSLIIPAYNEERHIGACLDSVAAQTARPLEVIVVDNNSTDRTAAIAAGYPFVRIVDEPVQGLIAARNRGFAEAKGDILARIDCDARLAPDWAVRVMANFEDEGLVAVTGPGRTCLLTYLPWPRVTLWSRVYFTNVRSYFRVPVLWGSNMAIRRSAWQKIRTQTSLDDHEVHEDQDLSILLATHNMRIKQDNHLLFDTGGEQFGYIPKDIEYALRRRRTRQRHASLGTLQKARQNSGISTGRALSLHLMIFPLELLAFVIAGYTTVIQLFRRTP